MSGNKTINILLVEDNPGDVDLIKIMLSEVPDFTFEVENIDRLASAVTVLHTKNIDVVLLDLLLPDSQGLDSLLAIHSEAPAIPIVVLTIFDNEEMGIKAVQAGAQDYLIKDRVEPRSLVRSLLYAMERHQMEVELRKQRDDLENLLQERADLLSREQEARHEAEEANDLKSKFLAMVSHELRTPLTSIKGFITTLLAEDVSWDIDEQQEFINIVGEETEKLTDLVEQLLEVSRLQGGVLRIQTEPRQLQTIIDTAMAQLHMLTVNHQLLVEIPPDLPPIAADTRRLSQVITNLVDNAVKYSAPETQIAISARIVGKAIRIDVRDQGDGIPQEAHLAVFEPFRQLERSQGIEKGAGLGLAICKGLVEAHSGRIWIEASSTQGTTISFTIPVAEPGAVSSENGHVEFNLDGNTSANGNSSKH
jgi:signal transduction histidine kinase